jgi:tRNA (cmo5U34)-methyltransferase
MSNDAPRQPEPMAAFFDIRADGYDDHMHKALGDLFDPYYQAIAALIPRTAEPIRILDLGTGTGAELGPIFGRAPRALFTCIDMSSGMLQRLAERYAAHQPQLTLIQGSYLEVPFETGFDVAVASMTMHHFLREPKQALYERIRKALKPGGIYIEGDYYATGPEHEEACLGQHAEAMRAAGDGLYHIDIPFTLQTQTDLLTRAGFATVAVTMFDDEKGVLVAVSPS